ncbi:MAG: M28 family peptidase [Planctomycetes bacterium]|nr:M28 family peptidase [Planctomycetota bacterium]
MKMVLSAAAVLCAACTLFAQEIPVTELEQRFSIAEYRAHLRFLADDLLEGRAPGSRGGDLAARYIAAQFEAAGLEPISEAAGYFQPVPMIGNRTDLGSARLRLRAGEHGIEVAIPDEAVLVSEGDAPEIRLEDELLFVGYGIDAPEFSWDDYKETDVRGKVLVMLLGNPDHGKTGFGSESLTYYGRWTYKLEIARVKGARGLVLLHTAPSATYDFAVVKSSWTIERVNLAGELGNPLTLVAWIARPALERALAPVGLDHAALETKAADRTFRPFPLGLALDAALAQRTRTFTSPNVIGRLPGAKRPDEAVIYMAHYDHLGIGPLVAGDAIYNGAIDNASGTAALLCLARTFAAAAPRPERTVLFLATTGEESGLLGSEYYTMHPVVPLEKTVLVLNKDCCSFLGRRSGFSAFPIQLTDAAEAVEGLGRELGLELAVGGVDRGGGAFRVDSFPFCARGVVGLSLWLRGRNLSVSEDEAKALAARAGRWYHQPNDEVHPYWRYDGIRQELALLHHLGRHYAGSAPAPKLDATHPFGPAIRLRQAKDTRRPAPTRN